MKGGEAYSPLSRLTVQSKLTELEGAVAELGLRCEASRPNLVECVKAAHAALQAMTPLVKGLDDGAVTVEASGVLSAESLERQATKAKELLSKTSKHKIGKSAKDNLAAMPQLVDALECPRFFCNAGNKYKKFIDSAQALGQETCRRAADAIQKIAAADPEGSKRVVRTAVATPTNETNDAKKPPMVPSTTNGGMVDKMWALLDRHFNPRENKVQRAVANALIALDEHEFIIGELTKKSSAYIANADTLDFRQNDTKSDKKLLTHGVVDVNFPDDRTVEKMRRWARHIGELGRHYGEHSDILVEAGATQALQTALAVSMRYFAYERLGDREDGEYPNESQKIGHFNPGTVHEVWEQCRPRSLVELDKDVCSSICVLLGSGGTDDERKARRAKMAKAGAHDALVRMLDLPQPDVRDALNLNMKRPQGNLALVHEVTRRAADAVCKMATDNEAVKELILKPVGKGEPNGVSALKILLERRDNRVQRAAAGALIALDEHRRLVAMINETRAKIMQNPDDKNLFVQLKQSVRTLAELAKDTPSAQPQPEEQENKMVDQVVSADAVEAIVPLLTLAKDIGEDRAPGIGDIEKEACYAIGLLASKENHQNRIADAGALPGLVALLKRYPPQMSGNVAPSVARRAADAVTNLAHENNPIKNRVRTEGGIPPLVALLETRDAKVQRAAASALRTLAFKNNENKEQIVEEGALPMLIFMVRSGDPHIHYEAVGVIGNLVHSSNHIKRRVLDEGALQPVIGLLSSECNESRREAALLLGQFATTTDDTNIEYKIKIVQRGAVQPLIQMLNHTESQLREMAAFALGRLAQNKDNQVGICHADGLRPLLDLLDSDETNLQHNAAFALYGLADNEDNVPDIIREGTVQRLMNGELKAQPSKDCVNKTLKRLEEKVDGRVLKYLVYLMRSSNKGEQQCIAIALAHLCSDDQQRVIFDEQGGLDILLEMYSAYEGDLFPYAMKDAAGALFKVSQNMKALLSARYPNDAVPLPATPETHLADEHFNNPELSDIVFFSDRDGGWEFHAHKIAFTHVSDEFHQLIDQHKVADTQQGDSHMPVRVDMSDVMQKDEFHGLMQFVYQGNIVVDEDLTWENDANGVDPLAQRLLQFAHRYEMNGLKRHCEFCMEEYLQPDLMDHPKCEFLQGFISFAERCNADNFIRACALFALQHHGLICKSIGDAETALLAKQIEPHIRQHLQSTMYRLRVKKDDCQLIHGVSTDNVF